MKKIFIIFGLIVTILFTFKYSNKSVSVVKEYDDIMINIKKNELYKITKKEPIINKNTYIMGRNGLKLDINQSYNIMRKNGYYDKKLLVYKIDYVNNSIEKNKNKLIIGGNKYNNLVSIIIILNKSGYKRNIDNLTYFANDEWIYKNRKKVDGVYSFSNINKISSYLNNKYCLYTNKNNFNKCFLEGYYTIKEKIIKNNQSLYVKNNLENGKIFVFEDNNSLDEELNVIYNYIKNKGYIIVTLDKLLTE